ncbi:uncharacterized protein KZ484_015749 [Pholidichthys leucotaenia]
MDAKMAVEQLANSKNKSVIVKEWMESINGEQPEMIESIRDLLTKREEHEYGKKRFSRLISDILEEEDFDDAVSVLKFASDKFHHISIFPQTLSRLYYYKNRTKDAEKWAKKAIKRAPNSSYTADTLGQIYKKRLIKARNNHIKLAEQALRAFEDVEDKAERETSTSTFNNRGLFGLIHVANIVFEKDLRATFDPRLTMQVEAKFDFFEWYLTYSKPDMKSLEPDFFWEQIACCYKNYTTKEASESTSFPGLLDCLNHGLFMSKGKRAGFDETKKTVSDLETIRNSLRAIYEENLTDVKLAERYILSNILLSNVMTNPLQPTLVKELQRIIHSFMCTEVGQRSPEFYLLVLMLFWPEEPSQGPREEDTDVGQQATADPDLMCKTWQNEDILDPSQTSQDLMFDLDLQQYAALMEKAFDRDDYAKYLQGRYLLPLFFLGKGSGLSKWIHKSKLDAIVEEKVDMVEQEIKTIQGKKKERMISNMWLNGEVWQIPEIKNLLCPVMMEPCHSSAMLQEHENQEVCVCAGEKKIMVRREVQPHGSAPSTTVSCLALTIKGPVVFVVGCYDDANNNNDGEDDSDYDNNDGISTLLDNPVKAETKKNTTMIHSPSIPDISQDEAKTYFDDLSKQIISCYAEQNLKPNNVKLFSFLALLHAYVRKSYFLVRECRQFLEPPDPISGDPPFERRMECFLSLIQKVSDIPDELESMIHQDIAKMAVEPLANSQIAKSVIVKNLMELLCESQPAMIQFIKDLLTKREVHENGKNRFSKLISDIMEEEDLGKKGFYHAVSVLKFASHKFLHISIFPQTLSRLYYYDNHTKEAEKWAKKAIDIAPNSSYVADTLGQVYKKCLIKAKTNAVELADQALSAFKDVEDKAEKEENPEMVDSDHTGSPSVFNNRGHFGLIQVANIVFVKNLRATFDPHLTMQVEAKFDFFEWYLIYSKPDMKSLEPDFFWEEIACCYKRYTIKEASESTSFPGLLDCLNHGLFMSKGNRAGFDETKKTVSDLETICNSLKVVYEENSTDVKLAERYILSNILLSNVMTNPLQPTLVKELQRIIHSFMSTEVGQRSPEFYLLVLMLFWPEEPFQGPREEDTDVGQQATGDPDLMCKTWQNKDILEPSQTSQDLMFDLDLQQYATLMEKAFDRGDYAKYLRGRYLLPLFFLGKGSGLSKWIHKSKLDAIVEQKVDKWIHKSKLDAIVVQKVDTVEQESKTIQRKKERMISNTWLNGEVWQIPEIKDLLCPVMAEPCHPSAMPQEHENQDVCVCAGEKKIKVRREVQPHGSEPSTTVSYLALTIKGPVVFEMGSGYNELCPLYTDWGCDDDDDDDNDDNDNSNYDGSDNEEFGVY